jgi:uncharacterized BrkB/YihY/UPF0761 family membrane protein
MYEWSAPTPFVHSWARQPFAVGRGSSYGALSVLLALLFWFYANGMILFFCAELCKVTTQGRRETW